MGNILQVFLIGLLSKAALALPLESNQLENNVGEQGKYFEGDMDLTVEQVEAILSPARNGVISEYDRWPNKTVPYQLCDEHTKEQRDYIELALKVIESVSCVKFVRRTNEYDYIDITAEEDGCRSRVGYQDNANQPLNLQKSAIGTACFRLGSIIHEFLHALGFYHMQSTYNRDEYVTIHWENIQPDMERNFRKHSNGEVTDFGVPYDYLSVMHYEAFGFSKNGQPTIVPIDEKYLKLIGQREGLSERDILKLNAMYKCND